MRAFFKFVLFAGICWTAYHFARPHVEKYLEDQKAVKEVEAAAAGEKAAAEKAGAAPETTTPKKATSAMPAVAKASKPKPKPKPSEIDKAVLELYPMPEIPPLSELVNDWTFIPERVFARKLVLKEAVDFELQRDGKVIGSRSIPAGSAIVATEFSDGMLTISPEGSSLLAAKVELDKTDLKDSIQAGYDGFVEKTKRRIESMREAERARMIRMKKGEKFKMLGWSDGSNEVFAPMKESLRNGGVTDYTLEDAQRFRWLGTEVIGGIEYEAGLVELYSTTIFGIFPIEGKALIRNGKVEKWVDPVHGGKVSPYAD